MVKTSASPAAVCVLGAEKKLLAPLICAALSQPEEDVNELKFESVAMSDAVIFRVPAESERDSPVKLYSTIWPYADPAATAARVSRDAVFFMSNVREDVRFG